MTKVAVINRTARTVFVQAAGAAASGGAASDAAEEKAEVVEKESKEPAEPAEAAEAKASPSLIGAASDHAFVDRSCAWARSLDGPFACRRLAWAIPIQRQQRA